MHNDDSTKNTPECHIQKALCQYQKGVVSLGRAAEMAQVDQETFKRLLQEAGIDRYIEPAGDTFEDEVEQLMRLRNTTA